MLDQPRRADSGSAKPPSGIVLYHPDPALLDTLLSSLEVHGSTIYVFLNGPVSAEIEARLNACNVHAIRSVENVGLGQGLNALAVAAKQDGEAHLILFDQDTSPEPDFVDRITAHAEALMAVGARVAVLGPKLVPPPGSSYLPLVYWYRRTRVSALAQTKDITAVDFVPTSGSLISLEAWAAIGPFRQQYFIGGLDVEWGYRAWASGWQCAIATDIELVHRWGEEVKPGEGKRASRQIMRQSPGRLFYYLRNAVDGLRLPHMPFAWKLKQSSRITAQMAIALMNTQRNGASVGLMWRALRDGWCGRLGPIPPDVLKRIEPDQS